MPSWLHFEDMELWGVPAEGDRGVWDVRIVERRKGGEKVVGRFALEVSWPTAAARYSTYTRWNADKGRWSDDSVEGVERLRRPC